MKRILFLLFLSIWGFPIYTKADDVPYPHHDGRLAQITIFMEEHHFVPPLEVNEIIKDADDNTIPAPLLVCIELYESSGGKRYNHSSHNRWGWESGEKNFTSERAAIDFISTKLGQGKYYKGKSLKQKLLSYNPSPIYGEHIINCINNVNAK